VAVPENISLARLHLVLQVVMGWTNFHLYQFVVGDAIFGEPDPDETDPLVRRASAKRLSALAKADVITFTYEYDFGDSWEHEITIEEVLTVDEGAACPVCLAGARACPPEDCGGIEQFEELLETLQDPAHEDHERMWTWVGEDFDPERFDRSAVNRTLVLLTSLGLC
jgi:hypothetical protein